MPEVLSAADHDFVMTESASKLKRLREKLPTARKRGSRRRGRRYLSILAAGFFVVTAITILVNALVWQRTRHPAPLFSRGAPVSPAKEPTIAGPVAVPASRPQPAIAPVQLDKPVERTPLEVPAAGHPREAGVTSPPLHDEISQLLEAPPARPAKEAAAPTARSKPVLAAQRALVKLGFVLNPDGVAGLATRQAIEHYERDHGLPVRGELSPALMRRLRAETGITIR
ncbi:MAG TPA: peptidoglycan-binding protein [Methylocella sp.]